MLIQSRSVVCWIISTHVPARMTNRARKNADQMPAGIRDMMFSVLSMAF